MLIFGKIWGLWGAVAATPVADGFSFLVTGLMIYFELRKLRVAIGGTAISGTASGGSAGAVGV
jgi:predicted PurR-regulated permease PerM